ncbi:nitrite/sulfite reductase [Parazoarcus communis]|uniref:Nitrite/sulfite reductase n=1 Tax=Parazoarcus communis SWub3 = DSM 12120 TaxID=1121029 RepID=A0A323UTU6_9RHOO|nr:nitrite/sulfite reductase [Parazoarcus communis]NMG72408.1 nitrite/sulfite reductase [Parazoarcus communis SWub3 = DSM 12120]PZA14626.1 nitrite/sulfite reductase [Azoarcus communis] [Parazoarcus communis SWub3 = DSM 12120]
MYRYNETDQRLVDDRVRQFRDQMQRHLAGKLNEDEFRPLRLQNGLYLQRHAPMLRVAIPYGTLSSQQMRTLAHIARTWDRGYGHFTTRSNIQFNWVRFAEVPDILALLATAQMHAIQTSGNCIRNITTDQFAGVAHDEILDPRPYCEIVRQWSALAPEFQFLPRKFKIAIAGGEEDRAAVRFHDIGARARLNERGEAGFEIHVGGGLGRTPMVGHCIMPFLPRAELLNYFEAILRVYNRHGRRDNKYKARIKILVKDLTVEGFANEVDTEWQHSRGSGQRIPESTFKRMEAFFAPPMYGDVRATDAAFVAPLAENRPFARWVERNVAPHRHPGHGIVTLSLKRTGVPPGDATADQMDLVADLADRFSAGEIRVSHEQNLILPNVPLRELYPLWEIIRTQGLATPNIGLLTDVVCCPGGDFCSLANAKSLPVAAAIQARFDDLDYLFDLGPVELNISGCVNACGHHHIGHIGILGVDKNNEEWYQVTLGGSEGTRSQLGKVIGPSFAASDIPDVIEQLMQTYVRERHPEEPFIDTLERIGLDPFKHAVYGERHEKAH